MPGGGSKPGERRGGRKPNTPNKSTLAIREQLEALGMGTTHDHPIAFMYRVSIGDVTAKVLVDGQVEEVGPSIELRVRAASEVAQYLEAKRKAVELSGPDGAAIPVTLVPKFNNPEEYAKWAKQPQK